MKKHIGLIVLVGLAIVILLTVTVTFVVDENRDIVLVKRFGKTYRVFNGRNADDAGLHFKLPWPIERVVSYDARTFTLVRPPLQQTSTRDKQNLLFTMFCSWRIVNPELFNESMITTKRATEQIERQLLSFSSNVIGTFDLAQLINTDPNEMKLSELEDEIKSKLNKKMTKDFGAEVVFLGVRNLGLPESVTIAVIEAMQKERLLDQKRFESAGLAKAVTIEERAKSASRQIIAFAKSKAAQIEGEGDKAAAEIYAKFDDQKFGMFLRELETLRASLEARSVLLLDGRDLPALKYIRNGPEVPKSEKK